MIQFNPLSINAQDISNQGILSAAATGLSDFILHKGADVDRILGSVVLILNYCSAPPSVCNSPIIAKSWNNPQNYHIAIISDCIMDSNFIPKL